METKLVLQIRYYERMYLIRDNTGEKIYTGTDKKKATEILKLLNGYYLRKKFARERSAKRRKRS